MQRFFLCALALLVVAFSVASAQSNVTASCDNILFTERLDDFWEAVIYRSTPEPYDGTNRVCSFHFEDGEEQCCNDVWYNAIDNVWARVRARAAVAVALAKAIRRAWSDARDKFRPVRRDVDKAYADGKITQQQRDALIGFIERVLAAWDKFLDQLVDDWANCLTMWLKYVAGILCLGCDPQWERYIYEDNNRILLKLTVETCNDIRSGCLPVWQLTYELVVALQDAVNQLLEDLGLTPVDYSGDQICNGDCGAWLCEVFFAGKEAELDSLPSPDAKKRNVDRIETVFGHLESQVTRAYQVHKSGPDFVQSFSNLLWTAHGALKSFEQVHRQGAGTSGNVYEDGGYNPIDVGSNSGLDFKVDTGSAGTLSSWLAFLL